MSRNSAPPVVVVGGGLAGLAAATVLAEHDVSVVLLESKRHLGGRAGSFEDPGSGEAIDHCQHVAMGCCTNFLDFCRRCGIERLFRRDRALYFLGPDGLRCRFAASRWLPAPLHLAAAFWRLRFLSRSARWAVIRGVRALARSDDADPTTIGDWLQLQAQPPEAIERFWSVVLVSALGETLDRASLQAARKVLVDGFLSHRQAYHVLVPTVPLADMYEQHVAPCLTSRGVVIRRSTTATRLLHDGQRITGVELAGGEQITAEQVVVAVPWRAAIRLLQGTIAEPLSKRWTEIESSPITGVHLWFDRPITDLPHAVLVGRLSQWLFARSSDSADSYYYQVVISASRGLNGQNSVDIVVDVMNDLRAVFPAAAQSQLLRSRVVTQPEAVFSVTPQFELLRPTQATSIPGLFLAGDWTSTHWPATMESAVRSGRLAAGAVLAARGLPAKCLVSDLPRSWLMQFV